MSVRWLYAVSASSLRVSDKGSALVTITALGPRPPPVFLPRGRQSPYRVAGRVFDPPYSAKATKVSVERRTLQIGLLCSR